MIGKAEHPASTIFPLMDGIELSGLVEDIRAHGLLDPIVLCDGQVLDGRNRLRACESAGVEPRFTEWEPNGMTPTEWVVSHNLHRRHLTTGQKAALAVDIIPRLAEEARQRQSLAGGVDPGPLSPKTGEARGKASVHAARIVGVGKTTVEVAQAIQKRDPEAVNRMRAGEINLSQAQRAVGLMSGNDDAGRVESRRDKSGREMPTVYFGKGDKWREASQPLVRYLRAFEKRDYQFGHVNPGEAAKRVKTIDQLIEALTAARVDLEQRSHRYRLTA